MKTRILLTSIGAAALTAITLNTNAQLLSPRAAGNQSKPFAGIYSDPDLVAERVSAVRAAVGRFPEDLREAIVLCEWEERSVAEAAAILEKTPKAVESRLYRAR